MDDRLRRVHQLLGELLSDELGGDGDGAETVQDRWYDPPMPPLEVGSKLSATDLLSWWFRPPSGGGRSGWDAYFEEPAPATRDGHAAPPRPDPAVAPPTDPARQLAARAVAEALLPMPDDELASEDAENAVQTFYSFLHAFGEGEIDACLRLVSDDYHVIEDDREIGRQALRGQLEALLASLHGWDYEVTLSAVPEPIPHPYGILLYVEIQIDATMPASGARRGSVERRVVFLERQSEADWKIAALSHPRV